MSMAALMAAMPTVAEEYLTNAAEIVKRTDWTKMEIVTVELSEHDYHPRGLRFKAGQRYKLELVNVGGKKHYFTAPEFSRSIGTRKVQSDKDSEIKGPYLLALKMMAEGV